MRYCALILLVFGFIVSPDTLASPSDPESDNYFARKNWERFHEQALLPTTIPGLLEQSFLSDQTKSKNIQKISSAHFVINVASRELTIYGNNEEQMRFPVGVGEPRYKTPIGGKRALSRIIWNPWWLPPDSPWARGAKDTPPGPRNPLGKAKMPLGDAILLHGTDKPYTVGHARSHGCLRMKNEDVIAVAWWLQKYFSPATDEALRAGYLNSWRGPQTVALHQAVPVEITYQRVEIREDTIYVHPDIYYRGGDLWHELVRDLAELGIEEDDIAIEKLPAELKVQETVQIPIEEILQTVDDRRLASNGTGLSCGNGSCR